MGTPRPPPLDCSPGVRFLNYGKNKDGYWDYEMFAKQVVDFMDAIEVLHPDWQMMLEVCRRRARRRDRTVLAAAG